MHVSGDGAVRSQNRAKSFIVRHTAYSSVMPLRFFREEVSLQVVMTSSASIAASELLHKVFVTLFEG